MNEQTATIYKCFTSDFETLTKRIKRITKKLDKNNLQWTFEVVGESIEEVKVYDYVNHNNIPSYQFTPKFLGKTAVSVTSYIFTMERLQLGNYRPIAVLDHTISNTENMIYNLTTDTEKPIEIPTKYRTVKSICEHCKSDRQRNKTVLLQDTNNNIIQVGTTCIKDFTGIDANDTLSIYTDIHDICLTEISLDHENIGYYPKYVNTLNYLANCIELINDKGYKKEDKSTKVEAWELLQTEHISIKHLETAQQVIDFFKSHTFINDFCHNIKTAVTQEYTKQSGFIAYAYIAYKKESDKEKVKAEKIVSSNHVGTIGDKIQLELTLKNKYSYEYGISAYNSITNFIYTFEDINGNVYTWKTSKWLENAENKQYEIDDKLQLKGTIKGHTEYKDIKQTELTRCKII